jgi:SAM-dependent methyltransferase/uncharacterized protein YbaR (Trm112 family)
VAAGAYCDGKKREARSKKREARSKKQEAGSKKREARSKKREAGSGKREAGSKEHRAPNMKDCDEKRSTCSPGRRLNATGCDWHRPAPYSIGRNGVKREILNYLICPECLPAENPLRLGNSRWRDEEIIEGSLECEGCGKTYPIGEGTACIVKGKGKQETGKSEKMEERSSVYERPEVLSTYLWTHYADLFGDPDVMQAYREWAGLIAPVSGVGLDAGCATGRFSFEMSTKCDLVIGVDASRSFVSTARRILRERKFAFDIKEEGLIRSQKSFFLPPEWNSAKVEFIVADAGALPFRSGTFGCVASLNVVDKTPRPFELIREACRTARNGDAQLLLSDPFSWSEEICPPEAWLGGTVAGRFSGAGIDNIARLISGPADGGPAFEGPAVGNEAWRIVRRGGVWWKIRNHRNHFELVRSLFLKAER